MISQITPIITGTWQAGKRGWVGLEDEDSIQTLRAALFMNPDLV